MTPKEKATQIAMICKEIRKTHNTKYPSNYIYPSIRAMDTIQRICKKHNMRVECITNILFK